jgi:hypothetical protein
VVFFNVERKYATKFDLLGKKCVKKLAKFCRLKASKFSSKNVVRWVGLVCFTEVWRLEFGTIKVQRKL